MTKESQILYWLSVYKPDKVLIRVDGRNFIYVFRKNGRTTIIEYAEPLEPGEVECVVRGDGMVEYFGTVENCLDYLKKR